MRVACKGLLTSCCDYPSPLSVRPFGFNDIEEINYVPGTKLDIMTFLYTRSLIVSYILTSVNFYIDM